VNVADEEPTPLDQLIDLFVYAPVGLLYEYDEIIPRLVRRGKSQVQLARVIGKMAVDRGGGDSLNVLAEGLATLVARRITEIGSSIGLAPPTAESEARPGPPAPGPVIDGPETAEDEQPLPIAGYDDLTAKEIIGLLDELDADQLARIRRHEEANRSRKTVLGKLDRLGA
jgi:hypothetical protein